MKLKIIIFIILLLIGLPVGLFFSWCINALFTGNTLNFNDFEINVAINTESKLKHSHKPNAPSDGFDAIGGERIAGLT